LDSGFEDVDEFISFSLSIQNRRKSRAGLALEHHLAEVFKTNSVNFTRGAVTENKSKPDFLFPSASAYHDPSFSSKDLFMLGSKSTCKDRWRQVLTEAKRINPKHLFTLEPGISLHQTNEMQDQKLQLVLPASLHETYVDSQQVWLMDLSAFITLVKSHQAS